MAGKKRRLPRKASSRPGRPSKKRTWYDLSAPDWTEPQARQKSRTAQTPHRRSHSDLSSKAEPSWSHRGFHNTAVESRAATVHRPRSRAAVVQRGNSRSKGYSPYPVVRSRKRKFPYFLVIVGAAIAFILYVLQTILSPSAPEISSGGGLSESARTAPAYGFMPSIEGVSIQYDYYSILGGSAEELRQQMLQRGPQDAVTGARFDGYTRWNLNWNFETQPLGGQCQVEGISVDAKAIVTMPQWNIPADVPSALAKKWKDYTEALREHELGHVDHARQAKQEILRSFGLLPPAPSCSQAQLIADSLGGQIIQKYAQKDAEYDRITGHGVTQGAVFP